jgi:hypothetical protein
MAMGESRERLSAARSFALSLIPVHGLNVNDGIEESR